MNDTTYDDTSRWVLNGLDAITYARKFALPLHRRACVGGPGACSALDPHDLALGDLTLLWIDTAAAHARHDADEHNLPTVDSWVRLTAKEDPEVLISRMLVRFGAHAIVRRVGRVDRAGPTWGTCRAWCADYIRHYLARLASLVSPADSFTPGAGGVAIVGVHPEHLEYLREDLVLGVGATLRDARLDAIAHGDLKPEVVLTLDAHALTREQRAAIEEGVVVWSTVLARAAACEFDHARRAQDERDQRAIADLARQDAAGETDDSYARDGSALVAVQRWYQSAQQAGDGDLIDAIDRVGECHAAEIYRTTREARS